MEEVLVIGCSPAWAVPKGGPASRVCGRSETLLIPPPGCAAAGAAAHPELIADNLPEAV
ncbi:hypothetical protein F4561_005382 [Lipingzhangella halophila]|uniref:Uncharacterized protein n=1 Tax=Lipingzhangella halophila TaxID=1783352 RepID=A0A7W7RM76_9ACTN|nr:hypothetical protein [Lipingzhangella halophila]